MEEKVKVNIYTDGACSGNPGPGAWACIINLQKEINKSFGKDEVIQYQLNQISRLVFSVVEKLQSIFLTIFFSKSQSKTSTLEIAKKTKK